MKARIKWIEGAALLGEAESGHAVVLDGPPESGGRNLGLRPMEMILLGLGGCTASDVVAILTKSRQAVTDCVVEMQASRAETPPKVFTHIHITYIVTGHNLQDTKVKRAIDLSTEKYCSATIMLRQAVKISHEYRLCEAGA
ncbi:MAG: OsmC family protein [Gammaproteobacteria bacterium]|jgi:putative redox protein